ncbi:unnamed protein product [Eruca vesicaria subsp. sativa]|uniref:Mannose-1-phosphate guanyltransferase C-terminal domain-containing protein n=1 Tax=Eruca vesicaria subsp. sativa TaxID=29727 RepID=A0ABC8K299_ERUVS|nr:unnamed protein product [Eruca vesicaria subsp. sativa]
MALTYVLAKIGPNALNLCKCSCWPGPGVRLISCIILDDVEIMENAVVTNAIVGWKSSIGGDGHVSSE